MIIITPNSGAAETHRSIMVLKCCYAVRSPCALPLHTQDGGFFVFNVRSRLGFFPPHGSFSSVYTGRNITVSAGAWKITEFFATYIFFFFFCASDLFCLRVFDTADKTVFRTPVKSTANGSSSVFSEFLFIYGKKPYYPSFSDPISRKPLNVYRQSLSTVHVEHHEYSISKNRYTRNL